MNSWRAFLIAEREHWRLLTGVATLAFVMIGICAITIGLLLDPLMNEFGWKNSVTSTIVTVYSLSAMLGGPLIGVFIDRIGSKLVMKLGIATVASGFLVLAHSNNLPNFYAAFVLIGLGYGSAFFLAAQTLIARKFGDQKNIGMGIFAGVGSIGAATFSLTVGWIIAELGWRTSSMISAALILGMLFVVIRFIPEQFDENTDEAIPKSAAAESRPLLRLIVKPYFALAVFLSALAAFGMTSIYFHIVPILMKGGLSSQQASSVFGATWLLSGIGSLCLGVVANRFGASVVLAGALLSNAVGTMFLIFVGSDRMSILAITLFIVLWGSVANAIGQFIPIVLVERFGGAHLGVLLGIQGALMGLVGSFAPVMTGLMYDTYAGYTTAILTSTSATVAAFIIAVGLAYRLRHQNLETQT